MTIISILVLLYNLYKLIQCINCYRSSIIQNQFTMDSSINTLFRQILKIFAIHLMNWTFYSFWFILIVSVSLSFFSISSSDTEFTWDFQCQQPSFGWDCHSSFDQFIITTSINSFIISYIFYPIIAIQAYLFSIIGDECKLMIKSMTEKNQSLVTQYLPTEMQHIHGAAYMLFTAKFNLSSTMVFIIIMSININYPYNKGILALFIIIGCINFYDG